MRRRIRLAAATAAAVLALAACTSGDEPEPGGGGDTGEGDLVEVPGVVVDAGSAALIPEALRIVVPCDGELCVWASDGTLVDRFDGGATVAYSSGPGIATDRIEGGTVGVVLLDPLTGAESESADAYEADDVQDSPGEGMRDVEFSPDGSWLAGVGADGVVRRWAAASLSDELEITAGGDAVAVAFSPDGSQIAVASSDAPVTIHDTSSGEELGVLDGAPQGRVAWSPDGAWIASASFVLDDEAETTVWDAASYDVEATLPRAGDHLAFMGTDALVLSVKDELDVVRWGWADDDVRTFTGATDSPRAVLVGQAGARIYAVSPRDGVLAWDVAGGEPTRFETPED